LVGRLDTLTIDSNFDGRFYPSYVKVPFLAWDRPYVDIEKNDEFKACTECGHLWSSVNPKEFNSSLDKCEWDGKPQIKPAERKSYFSLISSILLALLLIFIGFMNYNT
tara:strand:- start:346 stop:669 length:324 start_codon:yes stop_codon:yes gene_type:complete